MTFSIKVKTILLFTSLLFIASACSKAFYETHPDIFKRYMSLPEPKALAVAEEWNGGYAYGYGYRAQNLQEAKERAMLECKTRRQLYQLETECKIYMINDEIVQEK